MFIFNYNYGLKGIWTLALNANAMKRTDGSVQSGPPWQRLIDFREVGHFTGLFTHCALYIWLLKFTPDSRWTQSILMSSGPPACKSLVISLLLSFHLCPINDSRPDLEKDKPDSWEDFNRARLPPGVMWPFQDKTEKNVWLAVVKCVVKINVQGSFGIRF